MLTERLVDFGKNVAGGSISMGSRCTAAKATNNTSATILAGPRVYTRMAEDGCLPRALLSTTAVPVRGIFLQAAVALVMLWTATYEALLTYIGFTLGLSTAATVAGLIRLRLREGLGLRVPSHIHSRVPAGIAE